jgi:Protein of unknown function (DUF1566)
MKKYLLVVLAISMVVIVYWVYSNFILGQGVEIRNARVAIRGGSPTFNQYNGSATSGATDYEYYTQALGGVDDYNDAQSAYPTGSYQGSWTDCTAGNNWCGTGDSTYADAKDNQTGLIWSIWLDSGTTHTWFWANNCYYSGVSTDCDTDGEAGCRCTKLTEGSKTGCEALPGGAWRLPYQKELMQAYINGSSKATVSYLSSTGYHFWSSTTLSYSTNLAWITALSYGSTYADAKTHGTSYRVRCVR